MRNFEIQWSPKLCQITFKGKISAQDLNTANEILNGDRRYYATYLSLWDFTEADFSEVVTDQLYTIVALDLGSQRVLKEHKMALLVSGPHEKHLCEYYVNEMQRHNSTWEFKIFTDEADARAWLTI